MQLSISLDSKALEAAIGRMRGPEVSRSVVRALERRANEARKETVKGFISRSIGRGIFGRNDSGAWKLITLEPAKVQGDTISVTLHLGGLAALQEAGGRIRPHLIKPRRKKLLAFPVVGAAGFGGELVFVRVVHHPGATVPKHESLRPAAEKVLVAAIEDIRRDLVALWAGTGRAA